MSYFLQLVISGVVVGSIYALSALGFVLIYRSSRIFNFAQGIMVVFAALTLVGLGRDAEAQDALAQALELNPWLPERSLYRAPENRHKSGQEL